MSEVVNLKQITSWKRVLNSARRTIGKDPIDKEPSDSWKAKILLAEHSPIRLIEYEWTWKNLPYFVSNHLVRHHEGCEKFVRSQRSDRSKNGTPRSEIPQDAPVEMDMCANAQALINISRKRLCACASKETREAWQQVKNAIKQTDPIMASKMVKECVYRGFCPEFIGSCNFCKTEQYKKEREEYLKTDF